MADSTGHQCDAMAFPFKVWIRVQQIQTFNVRDWLAGILRQLIRTVLFEFSLLYLEQCKTYVLAHLILKS